MEKALIILLIILFVELLVLGINQWIIDKNPFNLYNRIYCRKNTKLWHGFQDIAYKFKYEPTDLKDRIYYVLRDEFGNERYRAVIWKDKFTYGSCTIHNVDGECILSSFDSKNSDKMYALLAKNRF